MEQGGNFQKFNNKAYYKAKSKHNYNTQKTPCTNNSKGYRELCTIRIESSIMMVVNLKIMCYNKS